MPKIRCLDAVAQLTIAEEYRTKNTPIKELAQFWKVSPRTISRVLINAGLATPVPRLQGEAYKIMSLLKKHKVDYQMLKEVLETLYG